MSSFTCPVYLKHVSATWQRSGPAITFFKKRKEGWRKCESFQKCEGAAAVDWLHLNTGNCERDAELHHCCWPTLGAHTCNHYLMQKWCCKCNKSESDDISFCACEFMKCRRLFLWKGSTDFWLSQSKMRQAGAAIVSGHTCRGEWSGLGIIFTWAHSWLRARSKTHINKRPQSSHRQSTIWLVFAFPAIFFFSAGWKYLALMKHAFIFLWLRPSPLLAPPTTSF